MKKNKSEINVKHLEFIQENIKRMNRNSFQIKTWTISIVTIAIPLITEFDNKRAFALFVGICIFYLLDSFYLMLEKDYRKKYNSVVIGENEYDFDMHPNYQFKDYIKALLSKTEWPVYICLEMMIFILWRCN